MLITFKCKNFQDIVMFGDVGLALLRGMGVGERVPGVLRCEDIPEALASLEYYIARHPQDPAAKPQEGEEEDEEEDRRKVGLQIRALPLIEMLNVADHEGYDVMWE